ncbi:MAG: hypothetical protein IT424_14290 [Pirellulales bacterium]|nr:hypothetical protein [Pirellulales bacterium]
MTTLFRALVMLSVLVGLPAAWVYYGPLPPTAQHVVNRFIEVAKDSLGWNQPAAPSAVERPEIEYLASAPHALGPPSTAPADALPTPAIAAPLVSSPPPAAAQAAPLAQQVEPLLEKLRRLGVVEYVLERWGNGGQYRFHCEMPLGSSSDVTQQFEAVTDDPQQSIAQVVAEVGSWQLARQNELLTR